MNGRHLQGELQYGMLPSPQDWPELYSWWDESTSRAHEWDGECIPSTGTGAGLELAWCPVTGVPWPLDPPLYVPICTFAHLDRDAFALPLRMLEAQWLYMILSLVKCWRSPAVCFHAWIVGPVEPVER